MLGLDTNTISVKVITENCVCYTIHKQEATDIFRNNMEGKSINTSNKNDSSNNGVERSYNHSEKFMNMVLNSLKLCPSLSD